MNTLCFLALIILCVTSFAQTLMAHQNDNEIDLRIGISDELVMLIYPEKILSRTAITPQALEKVFKHRIIIKSSSAGDWNELTKALVATKWIPSERTGDYRWALHFRSESKDVAVGYIDRKAGLAVIGDKSFAVSGKLLSWLAKHDPEK